MSGLSGEWRSTSQELPPDSYEQTPPGLYDLYPGFPVGNGKISPGFATLADRIARAGQVVIDGYIGVFWSHLRKQLDREFRRHALNVHWIDAREAMLPEKKITSMIRPYLGGDDPIFGKRFTGTLADFFEKRALKNLRPNPKAQVNILFGCGAALAGWKGLLIYIDLPKNELQYRSRAGTVTNLGFAEPAPPKEMYKQYYFVDWVALNKHKCDLVDGVDLIVDSQKPERPVSMTGDDFRSGLREMSRNYFRVRPWFEPGAWGGQWAKQNIPDLPQDVPNYAWSFELISPENGLMFESDGQLLEVSFDWLMYYDHEAILGEASDLFGHEFPIRFDYLDTVEGGNLSVQCHPGYEYSREHFGESFNQTETYYIMDSTPDAGVYLGFQEGIDPEEFRRELEMSAREHTPVDIERYVQSFPTEKHRLYLHPSGTIHSQGAGNMVLEISSTPYIFTFKMYDWLRVDLDGNPRPLNIERAFENLAFDRRGDRVQQEFISQPRLMEEHSGWQLTHLPTHPLHFYDVHRYEFTDSVKADTENMCHVMNLVEGDSIILETAEGRDQRINYAETFVVPAEAGEYRLVNQKGGKAMVVKAFVKSGWNF